MRPAILRPRAPLRLALLLLATGACDRPPPAAPEWKAWREDFEAQPVGATPSGFRAAQTVGELGAAATPARWEVAEADDAAGGRRLLRVVEAKNRGPTFNLLLRDAPLAADVSLSVRIHARSGKEDQGGGLVWRAQGADDYYVTRWNPIDRQGLALYKVEHTFRVTLATAAVAADPAQWHVLHATMRGRRIEVAFDGRAEIAWSDATFDGPGRVGLWTKADAQSDFDDFEVSPP